VSTLSLSKLVLDFDLYPRTAVSSTNVRNLVAALEAGHELPPLVVDRKSKRVVDGFHRYNAHKRVSGPDAEVEVELRTFKSDVELFAAAVEYNVGHGKQLDEIEKRRVVFRLQEMGADEDAVAAVLHTTPDKVTKLVFHSATVKIGGGQIKYEPLKKPLFHWTGKQLTAQQLRTAGSAPGTSYKLAIKQLRDALTTDEAIDVADESLVSALAGLRDDLVAFFAENE